MIPSSFWYRLPQLLGLLLWTVVALPSQAAPLVRGLVFYQESNPACGDLFRYLLPLMTERYGGDMELAAIEVAAPTGRALYQAVAARYSLGSDLPVALVGEQALVGLDAIAATLGDGFSGLASSGKAAQWPALAGLEEQLPLAIREAQQRQEPAFFSAAESPLAGDRQNRDEIANRLAVGVLLVMGIALVHGFQRVRQGSENGRYGNGGLWISLAVGLIVSAYTAYASLAGVTPVCGPVGSCDVVQHSEYAKILGIPLGVFGILGNLTILAGWRWSRHSPLSWRQWLPWGIALFGLLFSLRLTFLEPFVIGATCLWCLTSALSMAATFWLLSGFVPNKST